MRGNLPLILNSSINQLKKFGGVVPQEKCFLGV
jgi:hypothetical protein